MLYRYLNLMSLADGEDLGGGGGGGGSFGGGGGAPADAGGETPSAVSLADDTLVSVPGSDKPIKFGEWRNRYVDKADFTRTTQQYAAREKAWQDYANQIKQQYEERLKSVTPAQPQGQNSFEAELNALASREYVDGKTAAGLVQRIIQQGLAPLAGELKKRDQLIGLLYNKLEGVEGSVQGLTGRTSQADFQSKLEAAAKSAALPSKPVIQEFLQDIYLSHEGKDLDSEFPNMVKQRWSELVQAVREWDKEQADDAKRRALGIPTRGGAATPSKPARKGFETAEDIAKTWFPILRGGSDT